MNSSVERKKNRLLSQLFGGNPIAFVDVETTGVSPSRNRVIEVGIVRIDPDGTETRFDKLINPHQTLSFFIRNMTGISQIDLDKASDFGTHAAEIRKLLDGCMFIAHNASFDYGFIKSEFYRYNCIFSAQTVCTVKLSRKLFPAMRKHSLAHLIETFSIPVNDRHRALEDALAIKKWLQICLAEHGAETISAAVSDFSSNQKVKCLIPDEKIRSLPESCGVYIFRDTEGRAVYIGKSIDIRNRVKTHLSNDTHPKEIKISQQSAEIDYIETPGELTALLKESELIQSEDPVLNRKLKNSSALVACLEELDDNGYKTVRIKTFKSEEPDLTSILGIFRTLKTARHEMSEAAKKWSLCDKLLGLESTKRACFGKHIGRCKGACLAEEDPESYNLRFDSAMENYRIDAWPFRESALIVEQNPMDGSGTAFVVTDWIIRASILFESDSQQITPQPFKFEWNAYNILCNYIHTKSSRLNIQPISEKEVERLLET